jgi:hypothetical protein
VQGAKEGNTTGENNRKLSGLGCPGKLCHDRLDFPMRDLNNQNSRCPTVILFFFFLPSQAALHLAMFGTIGLEKVTRPKLESPWE